MSFTSEVAFVGPEAVEVSTETNGAHASNSVQEKTDDYTTDYQELLEPQEVDGFVKSRVTQGEFDLLRTEVGDGFFLEKGLKQSSRDRGAYTMLMELRRRGIALSGYRPANGAKFVTEVTLAGREKLLEAFKKKPGRKALAPKK